MGSMSRKRKNSYARWKRIISVYVPCVRGMQLVHVCCVPCVCFYVMYGTGESWCGEKQGCVSFLGCMCVFECGVCLSVCFCIRTLMKWRVRCFFSVGETKIATEQEP